MIRTRLRLAALALAILARTAASADDFTAAYSSGPVSLDLCGGGDRPPIGSEACKQGGYDRISAELDRAFAGALDKAPANVQPLLKRDQGFFGELVAAAAEEMPLSKNPEDRTAFADILHRRLAAIGRIADGFGRTGILGKWENVAGGLIVQTADDGAYLVSIDINAIYGPDDDEQRQWRCQATAMVRPSPDGWLSGEIRPEETAAETAGDKKPAATARAIKPPSIKIRRQGDTLRVVAGETTWEEWNDDSHPHCKNIHPVTGSYFASGRATPTTIEKSSTSFVRPTFDCARPLTASDEEICADPDLATNDLRLNKAWKALLPRLDDTTRRALSEDQRNWIKAQAFQYPEFLHPAWEKRTSFMHYTSNARDRLRSLQRERIALLEGFDESRNGFAGVWLSYTAILKVTSAQDGELKAEGWKWEQGDWKAGCEFDIKGTIVKGSFRSSEERKNPDTLERDHAMLIVNRLDDAFAGKRHDPVDTDEPKCKRSYAASSTARLFPVKPSPDINHFRGSIR